MVTYVVLLIVILLVGMAMLGGLVLALSRAAERERRR
jgi:hypothetical protein